MVRLAMVLDMCDERFKWKETILTQYLSFQLDVYDAMEKLKQNYARTTDVTFSSFILLSTIYSDSDYGFRE